MKTILVTGGAGFIGSAVIRFLDKNTDHQIVNVDKLTYAGNLESLMTIQNIDRYNFEKVDICDAKAISRVLLKYSPDIIMHLAAESHVDRSINGPWEFIQTNIIGTYNLLEQTRKYWTQLGEEKKMEFRFHHISTDEVYGDLPHPDDPHILNEEPLSMTKTNTLAKEIKNLPLFKETNAYSPSSPYSASKASSDHLVRAWSRTYGLPTLVTNCSNNYGPYHFPEKLIPLVILNALKGKPLPIYGKGNQIRDWLYVDDHARALFLVATKGVKDATYNIGGHNEKKNIEVVIAICDLLEELAPQKPKGVKFYKDLISFVPDRAGHDKRYAIDAQKIQTELNWTPLETFETGIRKTVKWYLDNQDWCLRVQDGRYTRRLSLK